MEHTDPWQVFAENGSLISGSSASRDVFDSDQTLIMGASHVWIWRNNGGVVEILLQKRSSSKKTWPGFYDVSAAGHIDADESAVESAVREAKEEIDITLDEARLYFIFSLRTPLDSREFDTVYLYKLESEVIFSFNDGEVSELVWKSLADFEQLVQSPDEANIVPQGKAYFTLLVDSLRRISS